MAPNAQPAGVETLTRKLSSSSIIHIASPARLSSLGRPSVDMSRYKSSLSDEETRKGALSPKAVNNSFSLSVLPPKQQASSASRDSLSKKRTKEQLPSREEKDDVSIKRHGRTHQPIVPETNIVTIDDSDEDKDEGEEDVLTVVVRKKLKKPVQDARSTAQRSDSDDSRRLSNKRKAGPDALPKGAKKPRLGKVPIKQAVLVLPIGQTAPPERRAAESGFEQDNQPRKKIQPPPLKGVVDSPEMEEARKRRRETQMRLFSGENQEMGLTKEVPVKIIVKEKKPQLTVQSRVNEVGSSKVASLAGVVDGAASAVAPPPAPKFRKPIAPRRPPLPTFAPVLLPRLPYTTPSQLGDASPFSYQDDLRLLHLREFALALSFDCSFSLSLTLSTDNDSVPSPSVLDEDELSASLLDLARLLSREIIDDGVEVETAWNELYEWMKKNGWKKARARSSRAGAGAGKFWKLVEDAVKEGVGEVEQESEDEEVQEKPRMKKFSSEEGTEPEEEDEEDEEVIPLKEDVVEYSTLQKLSMTEGLVNIWLSLKGCRGHRGLLEAHELLARAKRDYAASKKDINAAYDEKKSELDLSRPALTLNEHGVLSGDSEDLKRELRDWEEASAKEKNMWMRRIGELNVTLYLATLANRQRFTSLGSDLKGNEYWTVTPSETAIRKSSSKKQDCAADESLQCEIGLGLLVYGVGEQEKAEAPKRWWLIQTQDDIKKLIKWLEYQVRLSNFRSKTVQPLEDVIEKEKQNSKQIGAKLRTEDEDLNALVAGIKSFGDFLEGLEMRGMEEYKLEEEEKEEKRKSRKKRRRW
ncbi:hypothetical protein BT69DRAFT_1352309 [Atractiella rhizophila]|nr:hypothetical protein BT69DRAFT_1352309 [Atractiella rhizophila]